MNIQNFKLIMGLREKFASNRKKDKLEVIGFSFSGSEKLAVVKQGHRVSLLKVIDSYKEKDFSRKLSLIDRRRL